MREVVRTASSAVASLIIALLLSGCEGGGDDDAEVLSITSKGPTQSSPIGVSPDGANIWVVNPDSNTVGRIDASTNTLTDEVAVGDNPRTLALRGQRHVFVTNQASDSLSRIEVSTGEVRTLDFPYASAPYGVAVSPKGDFVVVTLERTQQVALVDPDSLEVRTTIAVEQTPRGIAISADGQRAYLSHFITFEPSDHAAVSEIDLETATVSRVIELPPDFVTCETDASGQGVTNLCSTIILPPDDAPAELANTVWVGCQRSNNVRKGLLLRSTMMGGHPFPADNFVGRSRNIFKASFHDVIRSIMARVHLDTGHVDYIDIDDGGLVSGIGFAPGGTRAYLTDERFNFFGVFNPLRRDPERPTITILGSDSTQPPGSCTGVFNDVRPEEAFAHFLPPSVQLHPGDLPQFADGTMAETGRDPFLGRTIPDGIGTTPIGLAISPDGHHVYAANFLSRSVTVVNGTQFTCRGTPEQTCEQDADCPPMMYGRGKCQVVVEAVIPSTRNDPLPAEILDGKILFNTAARDASVANDFGLDNPIPPLNYDRADVLEAPGEIVNVSHDASYIACASCHPEAGFDGRTWDFSQFGASLRNTMDLRGRSSLAPGTCANTPGHECVTDADCGSGVPLGTCRADPRFVPDNNPAVAAAADRYFNPMVTIHWNGDRDEVEDFEHTFRSLMGAGDCEGVEETPEKCFGALIMRASTLQPVDVNPDLGAPNRGLGPRLNHLADYVYSVRTFTRDPNLAPDGTPLDPAAERGRAVFNDPQVGCAGCHNGPSADRQLFTDKGQKNPRFDPSQPADDRNNPFVRRNVGTANEFDEIDPQLVAVTDNDFHNRPNPNDPDDLILPGSRAPLRDYLTPILTDVWLTAPYLHDGSARRLVDVVFPCNSTTEDCCNPVERDCTGRNVGRNIDDRHGRTSHLSSNQLQDLIAFLRAPHAPVADLPAPPPAEAQPKPVPPELPPPSSCPDPGEPPPRVGEPATLRVQSVGRFPTGMTIDLPSVGFTLPVEADGVVIAASFDAQEGIFQLDGSSVPALTFQTPAGPGIVDFDDRIFQGTFNRDTGEVVVENVQLTLQILDQRLCHVFTLKTGRSTFTEYEVSGQPFAEATAEGILADIILGPSSSLSPPLVTALIIEGKLITE